MKKEWINPLTIVQKFAANEYIAACGDSGVTYKFQCNAPEGTLYYYPDANTSAKYLGSFHPNPTKEHIAESTADFYNGFVDYNNNGQEDADEKVIVWIEYSTYTVPSIPGIFEGGTYTEIKDFHATTKLNMNSWETAKS